jgi:hypothetical protein
MNTLSFPELLKSVERAKCISSLFSAINEEKFPIDIEGSEGSLNALLIANTFMSQKRGGRQIFVIVPHEDAADDLLLDLTSARTKNKDGVSFPCVKFPWWGRLPTENCPL